MNIYTALFRICQANTPAASNGTSNCHSFNQRCQIFACAVKKTVTHYDIYNKKRSKTDRMQVNGFTDQAKEGIT